MAEYQLKPGQERFRMVDGPFANREYVPGCIYTEIPPEEAGRFAEIIPADLPAPPAGKSTKSKPAEVDNA